MSRQLVLGLMPKNATPKTCLAAGPWCFCGQEQDFPDWWQNFTFAPEPLSDPDAVPAAARAAQTLSCRMVMPIARLLCPEPDNLPECYWQILLMPWLVDVASQIVDRSLRLEAMIRIWGDKELQVSVLPLGCQFNFQSEHDFTLRGSLGIAFNHWLFSLLLRERKPAAWQLHEIRPHAMPEAAKPGLKARLTSGLRSLSLALPFPRAKGMTIRQALRFSRALNHPCNGQDHSLDLKTAFDYQTDLNKIPLPASIGNIFQAALPASLKNLKHLPLKPARGAPRLKMVNIIAQEDSCYRQTLARWRASGNRLGHVQHGGNYGMLKTACAAPLTEYSQDIFITWGWSRHGDLKGNFVPMPSVQLSASLHSWQGAGSDNLIFAGTEMAAYGHRLDSLPTPMQYVEYREAKAVFFRTLKPEITAKSLYRPYFSLPGTLDDAEWLLPLFPGLSRCEGPLLPQLLKCRLLVLDHHGTILLEAMSADIPVILYWKRKCWPLCAEADILLDMLEAAGIWRPDAASAAKKVNEIWSSVSEWWQTPEVRAARSVFCKHQALAVSDPDSAWIKLLQQI